MGIYLYAGGSAKQGRQEKGQVGEKGPGQPRESLLGRASADGIIRISLLFYAK